MNVLFTFYILHWLKVQAMQPM